MTRRAWVATIVVVLLLLSAIAGTYLWWLNAGPPEERRSLVFLSGGQNASSHPVAVNLDPALAAAGLTAADAGGGEEVEVQLFLQREKAIRNIAVATGDAPLLDDLVYELYDRDGNWIGSGRFNLDGALPARSRRTVDVHDVRLRETWTVIIRQRPASK